MFGVIERRRKERVLWDKEYPARQIYNETLELRIGDVDPEDRTKLGYRWLSDGGDFKSTPEQQPLNSGVFAIDLRAAGAVSGTIQIIATPWPDPSLTFD